MPPSVDSTSTQSACVTLSTRKKRDSPSVPSAIVGLLRKKSRGTSSLSETSPRRPHKQKGMGLLTQDSKKSRLNSKPSQYSGSGDEFSTQAIDINAVVPIQQHPQENFPLLHKNELLTHEQLCKEGRRVTSSVTEDVCIKSMVLHLENLARMILSEYDKEREKMTHAWSEIVEDLAQLRVSNTDSAKEVEKLRLEKELLVRKEATSSAKLDQILRERTKRDGFTFVAALILSKALMLKEKESAAVNANSELDRLLLENKELLKENIESKARGNLEIEKLRSALIAAEKELTEVRSETAELLRARKERDAAENFEKHELLSRLAAASSEVEELRCEKEAIARDKQEAESRLRLTIEADVAKAVREKRELLREKTESETLTRLKITKLLSDNAALIREREQARALATSDSKKLKSSYEAVVKQLKTMKTSTALEMKKLRLENADKNSQLISMKHTLSKILAERAEKDSHVAAEVCRLSREREESEAREVVALEKLRSLSILPRAQSEMHRAFLVNWGLLQPEDYMNGFATS